MSEEREYFPVAAKRHSLCPHCPEEIEPGDAIVKRTLEEDACHVNCARREDEIDADPERFAEVERAEWETRRQAEIEDQVKSSPGVDHERRKRKTRRRRRSAA